MHEKKSGSLLPLITGVLAVGLNIIINFVLIQYITNKIGIEANGFVTLSKNFISYVDIFMIALNAYAVRFISVSYHSGEKKSSLKPTIRLYSQRMSFLQQAYWRLELL